MPVKKQTQITVYNPTDEDLLAAWAHISDADMPAALVAEYPTIRPQDATTKAIKACAEARQRIAKLRGFA